MSILSDAEIFARCADHEMIDPMEVKQVREVDGKKVISYGLSSYGYDIRCSNVWKEPRKTIWVNGEEIPVILDPLRPDERQWRVTVSDKFILRPGCGVLATSVEKFIIPRDVIGIALGKSTYARHLAAVLVTPLEPEWEGSLTIEIANTCQVPVVINANQGILQIVFFKADRLCSSSYATRQGKYQNQGPVPTIGKI